MKIVIDISESIIEHLKDGSFGARIEDRAALVDAVMNGTPLPKGHGRLIDADEFEELFGKMCPSDCGACAPNRKTDGRGRWYDTCRLIDEAQTIIGADTESEDKAICNNLKAFNVTDINAGDLISRQAVIDRINRLIEVEKKQGTDDWGYGRERVNAYEAMLYFVKSEYLYPSVEPEQSQCSWYGEDGRCHFAEQEMDDCEDCISRTELLKKQQIIIDEHGLEHKIVHIGKIIDAPSVEPERKTGKWLKRTDKTKKLYGWYQCSQCGSIIGEPTNYCSECGSYKGGNGADDRKRGKRHNRRITG